MRNLILSLLACVDIVANLPYIIDIYKGKTKPNVASWSTWTLVNAITVVAALVAGNALNTVILGVGYLAGSFTILVLALLKGTRKYTRFDVTCQVLSVVGIICWLVSDNPNVALVFVVIAGELAAFPTMRHAYLHPHEETWSTFLVAAVVALAVLCLATSFTFAALAVPLDLVIGSSVLAGIILVRRAKKKKTIVLTV